MVKSRTSRNGNEWTVPVIDRTPLKPQRGKWSDLPVPHMELRIVDEDEKRYLLARFDGGAAMIIGEGYFVDPGLGARTLGPRAFRNPYENSEDPAFHRAAVKAGLKEHSKRRLWGALVEAFFLVGREDTDGEREKTLNTIRRMWEDPVKNWWEGNERLRWAGLVSETEESQWT